MTSGFFRFSLSFFLPIVLIVCFICLFFIPTLGDDSLYAHSEEENFSSEHFLSNTNFIWPLPGFTRISSPFGKRNSPTAGSSTNHSGIDIPAPSHTNMLAVTSGTVIFTGFKGAGGYTITIQKDNFLISYCHVSPSFLVFPGQFIKKGQIIGQVGPFYVDNVPDNPYKDKLGKPTNGATTGCHLHLTIKKDGIAVNPLAYF